jgi:hypothetical protein
VVEEQTSIDEANNVPADVSNQVEHNIVLEDQLPVLFISFLCKCRGCVNILLGFFWYSENPYLGNNLYQICSVVDPDPYLQGTITFWQDPDPYHEVMYPNPDAEL